MMTHQISNQAQSQTTSLSCVADLGASATVVVGGAATTSSSPTMLALKSSPAPRCYTKTILFTALLSRLCILWYVLTHFARTWLYSRIELGTLARQLALNHGFNSPFGGSTGPTAFMTPGYPFVISLVFRVFGIFSVQSVIAIMLLQIALTMVTVWLVMHIARETLGARVANLAGICWALSVPLIWMPIIFWDTSASVMLLTGMVALALRLARRPTFLLWSAAGVYCGLTMWINPSLVLALLAILGWAAYQTRRCFLSRKRGGGRAWAYGPAAALLLLLAVFAPWPVRNARVLHAFIPLRSSLGFEFWDGNQHGGNGFFIEKLHPVLNKGEFHQYATLGEVGYMQAKARLAEASIRAHPVEFIRVSAWRVPGFWFGLEAADSGLVLVHCVVTSCLGLCGLLLLFKRKRRLAWLFLLPLFVFPLPYYITHPDFRFRLLLDPLVTILAAYALVAAWRFFRADRVRESQAPHVWR